MGDMERAEAIIALELNDKYSMEELKTAFSRLLSVKPPSGYTESGESDILGNQQQGTCIVKNRRVQVMG